MRLSTLCSLGIALVLFAGHSPAQRLSFEVVSIKPNKSGDRNGGLGPRGSRLVGTNITLYTLLMYAYRPQNGRILDAQIVGAPGWAQGERFDIEAKPEGDARVLPGEQTREMVRSLLEDYFQLKIHRETRDLPVYNLILTKKGPKLSEDQTPLDPRQAIINVATQGAQLGPLPRGTLRMVTGPTTNLLTGTGISVPRIAELLQSKSDRPIIDKTDFAGLLDLQLTFRPDVPEDASPDQQAPSLFTAIQDLGLKLEPGKAPLDVLVIDRVERPREN